MINYIDKTVLVTGGTGMIGRQLVPMLLKRGARVRVADLNKPTKMSSDIDYRKADLRNFNECKDVCEDVDYVFNLVGIKCSPKVCIERPADIMGPMLQFNTNMLEAAMMAGVSWYLYTSTVGVYEPAEILVEDDVWKTQPSKNDWFGGWAKRMGELQCLAYERQYGSGRCSIVRPANVYGPWDNFDISSAMVIPSLIEKASKNRTLEVWGDGSSIRDFIYSEDVARGMLFAVDNKITEPINLGSGEEITIKRIAEIVAKYFDKKIEWDTSKPTGDLRRIFDMTRSNSYGFKPIVPVEVGILKTIEWYMNNKCDADRRFDPLQHEKRGP